MSGLGRVTAAKQVPVSNEYWGESIEDRFQYLEDPLNADQRRWSQEQADRASKFLPSLPGHDYFRKELERIVCFEAPTYFDVRLRREGGERVFFAQKRLPPNPQPLVVAFASVEGASVADRVLFNPATAEGVPAVDWMEPSPEGGLLAMSLSVGGTERGNVHVLRVATGELIAGEMAPRSNSPTAGGSLAWAGEAGFYYTRHPMAGEVAPEDLDFFQKIYYHELGKPAEEDILCLGQTFPRIAECQLLMSPTGKNMLCACADGDGGEFAIYVSAGGAAGPWRESKGAWRYIAGFKDGVKDSARFSPDGDFLILLSRSEAPMGKLVRLELGALATCSSDLAGEPQLGLLSTLVPQTDGAAIEDFVVTGGRIYVSCLVGGPSKVLVFDSATGAALEAFPTPEAHVVFGMIPLPKSSEGGDDIYFTSMGYTAPRALQRFNAAKGSVERTALVQQSPVDFSDVEARTIFSTSKDGTKIPMTIVRTANGPSTPRPCVLYAYGGYGISMVPSFRASLKVWLQLGGLYVVANIRGGAEYGEAWHLQGNLTKKQNCFDDFLSSAEHLIAEGYTSKELLCIQGGSNGGLLMGACMTQRPDLFRAVVAQVGIFDSLRTELEPNGVFNIPEFGTVKDEAQYRALRAYSPYHNIPASCSLPSLLLTTGENDGRVASWQSKKFAAALQPFYEEQPPERHLVLRITMDTGHGMGTPLQMQVEEMADVWSFIASSLGVSLPAAA